MSTSETDVCARAECVFYTCIVFYCCSREMVVAQSVGGWFKTQCGPKLECVLVGDASEQCLSKVPNT